MTKGIAWTTFVVGLVHIIFGILVFDVQPLFYADGAHRHPRRRIG